MTEREYRKRLESYSTSNAPIELKEQKIKELNEAYYGKDVTSTIVEVGEIDYNEVQDND